MKIMCYETRANLAIANSKCSLITKLCNKCSHWVMLDLVCFLVSCERRCRISVWDNSRCLVPVWRGSMHQYQFFVKVDDGDNNLHNRIPINNCKCENDLHMICEYTNNIDTGMNYITATQVIKSNIFSSHIFDKKRFLRVHHNLHIYMCVCNKICIYMCVCVMTKFKLTFWWAYEDV